MSEQKNEKRQAAVIRSLKGQEQQVYPVLRHASMVREDPKRWVWRPHTADTLIMYALDQGKGYSLIEQRMLEEAGWSADSLHERALRNLQKLPFTVKTQESGAEPDSLYQPAGRLCRKPDFVSVLAERF